MYLEFRSEHFRCEILQGGFPYAPCYKYGFFQMGKACFIIRRKSHKRIDGVLYENSASCDGTDEQRGLTESAYVFLALTKREKKSAF